uniref:GIY-YIG domain-containing protein n=2 Tax=Plectus sambesii TaxID=2011161 RepID=A0A914XF07_9BILA
MTCYCHREECVCDWVFVVYTIMCKKCGDLYVGKTSQRLGTRLSQHYRSLRNDDNSSAISAHARECHNLQEGYSLYAVSGAPVGNQSILSMAEGIAMNKYNPQINRKFERHAQLEGHAADGIDAFFRGRRCPRCGGYHGPLF